MRHIPNILSGIRILLIPFFVWQMALDNTLAAAIILLVSGATDLLDGFLARRYNWVSDLGKILDPAADKLTQGAVCIMLIITMPQYWYFFALLLFKEFVMLILGGWLVRRKVHIKSSRWFGKVVTTLFYVIMTVIIFFPNIPFWATAVLLGLVTVCAFAAGVLYIPQFIAYLRQVRSGETGAAAAEE